MNIHGWLNEFSHIQGPGAGAGVEAGALRSRVFPGAGAGAGALNFPKLWAPFVFYYSFKSFLKNYVNIQYFDYNRKNEWEIIQDLKIACKYK